MVGIIDKVDLEASSDWESSTRCRDINFTETAVDCCNEDFRAGWQVVFVLKYRRMRPRCEKNGRLRRAHLIDEDHGELGLIGVNPHPSDGVKPSYGPSGGVVGSEDGVGASGGDQGKECEEREHVVAKRRREGKGKSKRGRREGERYKGKERGFVDGWPT